MKNRRKYRYSKNFGLTDFIKQFLKLANRNNSEPKTQEICSENLYSTEFYEKLKINFGPRPKHNGG